MMLMIPGEVKEWFSYNPETGVISWAKAGGLRSRAVLGAPVSFKAPGGYAQITFGKHVYSYHRMAWFLATGAQPKVFIDHRNRNPLDNRLCNLREATGSQNMANTKGKGLRDLPKGVCRNPSGSYRATITVNRRQLHLGTYRTVEDAQAAYIAAATHQFGEFARAA